MLFTADWWHSLLVLVVNWLCLQLLLRIFTNHLCAKIIVGVYFTLIHIFKNIENEDIAIIFTTIIV